MQLFEGFQGAYGIYGSDLQAQENSPKLKAKAYSIKGAVTAELWEKHVKGEQSLGIIPINEKSQVRFAAIDVDQYPCNMLGLKRKVDVLKYPLVPVRTKSGGVHLYLFLTEFYAAHVIQDKMREFAVSLGIGDSEIFPKQTKILSERGDIGQWINMPYFRAADTDRWSIDENGNKLSVSAFIDVAMRSSIDAEDIKNLSAHKNELLPGGPPCLNHLLSMGFPEGTRNNALFNMGVYARKAHPDDWKQYVEEYNEKHMTPPLDATEVLGIIKSLSKKEFNYMCKQPPIAQYCNMPRCRGCKHGIGAGTGMPRFGTLSKLTTEPPIWFISIEGGGRLELSTEELQTQTRFQYACMQQLNIMPTSIKRGDWEEVVQRLLDNVDIIEMPPDLSPSGILLQCLEDFCTSRSQAKNPDEMLLGKPWINDGWHYFRMRDFIDFLERKKFKAMPPNYIAMNLNDWGAKKGFMNLKGKGCNYYKVPEFKNVQTQDFNPVAFIQKEEF